ncbi:hypothetical protein EYZ11_003759 [Aspergillus tanneri]|uniref:Peroxin 20 n=1 Tax=Aspergillus tanneri TaxID=1220188 RepID=A0A4S3JMU4_9EURO|nr:uncharacterized protein ATNIH1004_005110 [Aspergillus tanneri]KAA8649215.1 hypothetical protein ATNIH1004_005110 [Aspergillus tanneri]THC96750.1 hypothetical protein EYZ11_003759 [Aspergillus tanneri]
MSDSLCGPSNALQNLQKHASADRTLQQDRLVSRQPSSQGFRSQSLNQGILDHEFAAFESNTVDTPVPNLQHAAIPFSARSSHHAIRSFAENQNWATDFQRLQISGPSHTIYQHRGPLAASASAVPQQGWQNEFLKQQQQPDPTPQWHQQGLHPAFASSHSFHAASVNAHPIAQEATSNQQPATQVFDESAFEAAFEQAKADMMSQDIGSTQDTIEESSDNTIQLDTSAVAEPGETIRIGSDTIPQTNKSDTQAHNNNADELARTAGHLLQSVSHDQSQKFKESNFLALMRRIRDREVHVEGDEFREVSTSS